MMKYTSTIKSRQFILAGEKKIFIEPGKGEMTDNEALAVAKSPWGKRLVETGSLTFETPIEVKDEKVERGMTIPKGEQIPSEEPSGDDTGDNEGDNTESGDVEDGADDANEDEIPDFDKNKNTEGGAD
jgi:hypothetical protein